MWRCLRVGDRFRPLLGQKDGWTSTCCSCVVGGHECFPRFVRGFHKVKTCTLETRWACAWRHGAQSRNGTSPGANLHGPEPTACQTKQLSPGIVLVVAIPAPICRGVFCSDAGCRMWNVSPAHFDGLSVRYVKKRVAQTWLDFHNCSWPGDQLLGSEETEANVAACCLQHCTTWGKWIHAFADQWGRKSGCRWVAPDEGVTGHKSGNQRWANIQCGCTELREKKIHRNTIQLADASSLSTDFSCLNFWNSCSYSSMQTDCK